MAKGAKVCPACGTTVGCRTHTCGCGHQFSTAIAGTEEHKRKNEDAGFFPVKGYTILTPAGKCPVGYTGDLETWVMRVQQHAGENFYGVPALRYWLRGQVNAEEFLGLAARLTLLCGEKV